MATRQKAVSPRPPARPELVVIALAAALVGGCGASDNGVASKSPAEILAAAQVAAQGARFVHVEGQFAQGHLAAGGPSFSSSVDLAAGEGARGRVSLSGLSYEAVLVGTTVYFKAHRGLETRLFGKRAALLPAGAWLTGPARGVLGAIAATIDPQKLIARLLASNGQLTKGRSTNVAGQRAIALTEGGRRLYAGEIYVATNGKPYPLQIVKTGTEHGRVTFSRWDQPIALSAPAPAVEVAKLASAVP
jgi:hypothetical protein